MRTIGQVIGASPTTATRRSVIFRSDGFERVLTFWRAASASRPVAKPSAPAPAAAIPADLKKDRRPTRLSSTGFIEGPPAPRGGARGPNAARPAMIVRGRGLSTRRALGARLRDDRRMNASVCRLAALVLLVPALASAQVKEKKRLEACRQVLEELL